MIGAEVWVKIAAPGDPPPAGPGELKFLLLSTRTPAVAEFTGPDGGQAAYYMAKVAQHPRRSGPACS